MCKRCRCGAGVGNAWSYSIVQVGGLGWSTTYNSVEKQSVKSESCKKCFGLSGFSFLDDSPAAFTRPLSEQIAAPPPPKGGCLLSICVVSGEILINSMLTSQ